MEREKGRLQWGVKIQVLIDERGWKRKSQGSGKNERKDG